MSNSRYAICNQEIELYIEKLVYGGYGLAYHDNKTIFIPNVIAGETVLGLVTHKKKGVFWAKLLKVIKPSEFRQEPHCRHFLQCGGCNYQHIPYSEQVNIKNNILQELFPSETLSRPLVNSENINYYRNKCEFTFANKPDSQEISLGLHLAGQYFEILDLQECNLLPETMWNILQLAKKLITASKLDAYHDIEETGFFATMTIRHTEVNNQENYYILWKVKDPENNILENINQELLKEFSEIKSVFAEPTPRGEIKYLMGDKLLNHKIGDLSFQYQIENFFQINRYILPQVLDEISSLVINSKPKLLIDLFAGVGSLGISSAYQAQKELPELQTICAEVDQTASEITLNNSQANNLSNFRSLHMNLFKGGWGDDFVKILAEENINSEDTCVIVDPPRAGLSKKTIKQILKIKPKNLIYMSCNPTTQARDIKWLKEMQVTEFEHKEIYKINSIKLLDMFPQTYHIESLIHLSI